MPDYTSNQLIVLLITLFLGGILQSTVGFGYALLCIPIFVAAGIPLNEAVIIIVCSAFFQSLYTFYTLRKEISIKKSFLPASIRIVALSIGIAILSRINDLPKEKIQLFIGIAVLSLVLLLWFWKPKKSREEELPVQWTFLTFTVSGIFSSISGMGGPPIVIWSLYQPWSAKKIRAFLFSIYLLTMPPQFLFFYLKFGNSTLKAMLISMLSVPIVLLGSFNGQRIGNKLNKNQLKNTAFALLLIIALKSILASISF